MAKELEEAAIGKCMERINAEKWGEALACLDEVAGDYPGDSEALVLRGVCFSKMEKFKEALECFERVVYLDEKNPQAFYGKGLCFMRLGRLDDAIDSFKRCVEIDENSAEALFQLWAAHVFKGEGEMAFPFFLAAYGLDKRATVTNCRAFLEGAVFSDEEIGVEEKKALEKLLEGVEKQ